MSDDVETHFKVKIDCPCGCLAFGILKKPFSDGSQHVAGCDKKVCARCRGRISKRSGSKAQRTASKMLAVPRTSSIQTGHEEHAQGLVRFEAKSGAQVKALVTSHTNAEAQSEAARAHGDNRPVIVMSLLHPTGKEAIVSFRARNDDEFRMTVAALAMQLGLIEA